MELPKTVEEKNAYVNMIRSDQNGRGVAYIGACYHLEYYHYTPSLVSLKCEGVILNILKNGTNESDPQYPPVVVRKEGELSVFDKLNGKESLPFKIRLKEAITAETGKIQAWDDHNRRVKETAERVVKCHIQIDDIVSEVTGGESRTLKQLAEEQEKAKMLPPAEPPVVESTSIFEEPPEEKKIWGIETELERQNRQRGINLVLDEAAQSRRASALILNAEYSLRG
jgi:hypothetical protein